MVRGRVAETVAFWPMALLAVIGSTVGVIVALVADKVVVTATRWGVEMTVIALISTAGNTVVEITATATGLPLAASTVVAFSVLTCIPGKKPGSGCPKRRKAPSKSKRQTITARRARRGVKANVRLATTWVESATRVMASSMRISIQPL